MRLVLLIVYLLLPSQSQAMPQAVAAIAIYFGTTAAVVIAVGQLILTVGMAIYGAAQARKAERKARDDYNASLQDRTITSITSEAPHAYVYGRAKVGSTVVAIFTSGAKDEHKHLLSFQ